MKLERNDKCFCGSGLKYKKCHGHINSNSVLANIYEMRNIYDLKVKSLNICSKCAPNCYKCCNHNFFISEQEFLLILDYMDMKSLDVKLYIEKSKEIIKYVKNEDPAMIEQFLKKVEYKNKYADFLLCTNIEEKNEKWPFCVFLENGKCLIYNVRPFICRSFGTTGECNISNNKEYNFDEQQKAGDVAYYYKQNNGSKIFIRPFPIYYWLGHFMGDEERFNRMYKKLEAIRNLTCEDYIKEYPALSRLNIK